MALVNVSSISWPTHSWAVWLGCRGPLLHWSNANCCCGPSSSAAAYSVADDAAVNIAMSCCSNMFVRWRITSDGADRERLIAVIKTCGGGVQVSGPALRMRLLINNFARRGHAPVTASPCGNSNRRLKWSVRPWTGGKIIPGKKYTMDGWKTIFTN